MELSNEFTVAVPVDEAWSVITDLERIAPCMPGAQLQEVEGDEYRGIVKIKVGPITAQYKGAATFLERDVAIHRAVLRAEGRDTRGAGNAAAVITANLVPEGAASTRITVDTDLTITGKVAQFGRGVLGDVSTKLIGQFADSLNAELTGGAGHAPTVPAAEGATAASPGTGAVGAEPSGGPEPAVAPAAAAAPVAGVVPAVAVADVSAEPAPPGGPRVIDSRPAEPIDLLGSAGSPIFRRLAPIVGVVALLLWMLRRKARRRT